MAKESICISARRLENYATDQGSYGYDAAGNLASDSRKGLLFSYNLANFPSKVEGMGYNAGLTYSYGYLSDGTKTSADCGAGSTAQGLRYRGSFVYEILGGELERLQSISWPEGRIVLEYDGNDTEPCLVSYDWLVTDHLGSVRAIAGMRTGSTGVKEVNGYLPFGTRLPGSLQSSSNLHRFGGKEEQRIGSTDLKLLDFGARYYDAFACRWTSLDPLAWKYPAITPYAYCAGNPMNIMDPEGRDIWTINSNGEILWKESCDNHYLYFIDDRGNITKDFIAVSNAELLYDLENASKLITRYNGITRLLNKTQSTNADEVLNIFKFASDHSRVEWVVHRNGTTYTLGTIHDAESSGSYQDYDLQKPNATIHSHPDVVPMISNELESMGYLGNGKIIGDCKKAYHGLSPKFNYVYFPNSSRLYNVEKRGPKFIRKITKYKGFLFGTLNN